MVYTNKVIPDVLLYTSGVIFCRRSLCGPSGCWYRVRNRYVYVREQTKFGLDKKIFCIQDGRLRLYYFMIHYNYDWFRWGGFQHNQTLSQYTAPGIYTSVFLHHTIGSRYTHIRILSSVQRRDRYWWWQYCLCNSSCWIRGYYPARYFVVHGNGVFNGNVQRCKIPIQVTYAERYCTAIATNSTGARHNDQIILWIPCHGETCRGNDRSIGFP